MKQFIILAFFIASCIFCKGQGTSSVPVTTDSISHQIKNDNSQIIASLNKQGKDQDTTKANTKALLSSSAAKQFPDIKGWKLFLSLLPAILFLLMIIIIMIKLKNNNVNLSEYLIDKEQQIAYKKEETKTATAMIKQGATPEQVAIVAGAGVNADNENDGGEQKPPQSTSRLLVFISGMTSVIIAVCITCFYMYQYFSGEANPSLGNLSTVLLSLGIGVVPYGFTKISGAMKP